MTIEEEDLQSVASRQAPKSEVRRLRKMRREIAASEKKRQVRALIERRQQVEQQVSSFYLSCSNLFFAAAC